MKSPFYRTRIIVLIQQMPHAKRNKNIKVHNATQFTDDADLALHNFQFSMRLGRTSLAFYSMII